MKTTLLAVPGIENTSNAFRWELLQLAKRLGLSADYLAVVISIETAGTFDPTIRNPESKAIGLIQWTISGAKADGTTQAALAQMTAIQQLAIVEKRYRDFERVKLRPADYYLVVFAPAYVGKPLHLVMYDEESTPNAYQMNKQLDLDNSGSITGAEAVVPFYRVLSLSRTKPRVAVDPPRSLLARLGIAALGCGGAAVAWYFIERTR